ncbi:MAG: hypothetical protein IJ863_08595 [Spirochaetales bacterium]|nr:hypothetical protein [Spirochaetales bacterium]
MKKLLFVSMLLIVLLAGQVYADGKLNSSAVTIASVVSPPEAANPSIIIGIGSAELSYYMTPDQETTAITGINLMEDGRFTFALMTSEEVRIFKGAPKNLLHIEVRAEGFHFYDYNYTGYLEGSSMDESNIKQFNAVPLLSTTPYITISTFYGSNENVEVRHVENQGNKIEVEFLEGITKAELILGTFTVEWKGKRPLEAGIYKAKVSIIYSTP